MIKARSGSFTVTAPASDIQIAGTNEWDSRLFKKGVKQMEWGLLPRPTSDFPKKDRDQAVGFYSHIRLRDSCERGEKKRNPPVRFYCHNP